MGAPILPLDPRKLDTLTNAGVVGAWMLFPDDEAWRTKFITRLNVLDIVNNLEKASAPTGTVTISTQKLGELAYSALEAATSQDIDDATPKRHLYGVGAGLMIYNGCLRVLRNEERPMTRTLDEVKRAVSGFERNSNYLNTDLWKRYRPVSAFWAAWVYFDDGDKGEAEFPCPPAQLPEFLMLAEKYRILAGKTADSTRKGRPILSPEEAVRLPLEIETALSRGTLLVIPSTAVQVEKGRE